MADQQKQIPLFEGVQLTSEGALVKASPLDVESSATADHSLVAKLLPITPIELSPAQAHLVHTHQLALLHLGAAGTSAMLCAAECPIKSTCPLARIKKNPLGQRCPIEMNYAAQRFLEWVEEFGRTIQTLAASERASIATLVGLDIEEMRCRSLLAMAENASLTQMSVRDVDAETSNPISWEYVIHQNATRINEIVTMRRMILKDYELTPEQKTRKAKWLGIKGGDDLASHQTDLMDKFRKGKGPVTVDGTAHST